MFDFSPIQIIIVLVIALVVFGPKRLPEMGRNLGRSLREFKSSVSGDDERTAPRAEKLGPAEWDPASARITPEPEARDEHAATGVEAVRRADEPADEPGETRSEGVEAVRATG